MVPRDRGQVVPLLALVIGMTALLVVALARAGAGAVDRAQARTAADAAALAAAVDGPAVAAPMAEANGAALVSVRLVDGQTEVVVAVGLATATARAAPDGGPT